MIGESHGYSMLEAMPVVGILVAVIGILLIDRLIVFSKPRVDTSRELAWANAELRKIRREKEAKKVNVSPKSRVRMLNGDLVPISAIAQLPDEESSRKQNRYEYLVQEMREVSYMGTGPTNTPGMLNVFRFRLQVAFDETGKEFGYWEYSGVHTGAAQNVPDSAGHK